MELTTFTRLTKLKESFFGLPMVVSGVYLASLSSSFESPFHLRLLAVFPAFFFARFGGMALNQLIDRKIDAKNPRTKDRVLPTNKATPKQVSWIVCGTLLGFVLSCALINTTCFLL